MCIYVLSSITEKSGARRKGGIAIRITGVNSKKDFLELPYLNREKQVVKGGFEREKRF